MLQMSGVSSASPVQVHDRQRVYASDQGQVIFGLESDNDALLRRLASKQSAYNAKIGVIEANNAMVVAMKKTETTLRETVKTLEANYKECLRLRDVDQKFLRGEQAANIVKAVDKAVNSWKVRGLEYRRQVDALNLELAEERRPKDAADERARKAEEKIVVLEQQLAKLTQEANKYRIMVDDLVGDLDGDSAESLQDRVRIAEEDRQLGWERCNILQRHTDAAKKEKLEAEALLGVKDNELRMMNKELQETKLLLAYVRKERLRDGKGEIFHEDGRVLIKCERCSEVCCELCWLFPELTSSGTLQLVEDPIAHTNIKHATKDILRRVEPCPLGCGMILRVEHYETKVPASRIEQHTSSDVCRARLDQIGKARCECAQFMAGKVAGGGDDGMEFQ